LRLPLPPGIGNGDLTVGAGYPMAYDNYAVAVADLDGDGNADLATPPDADGLAVRRGRGDGTFAKRRIWPALDSFSSRGVADFNRDGRLDLASPTVDAGAEILLNWTGLDRPPCVVIAVVRERFRSARHEIDRAGCRVGHLRHRYSRTVRKGRVISQRPRPGAVLPARGRVALVVSRGQRR
jgi:hypothetical protein